MKNRNQKLSWISFSSAVALLAVFFVSEARADIVSAGGTLTNVSPGTVDAGATSFTATHTTFDPPMGNVADTSVSGTFGTELTLNATANVVGPLSGGVSVHGQATGTLDLTVTATETVSYSWLETTGLGYGADTTGTLTLTGAGGVVVLGCTVANSLGSQNPGGCEAGAMPSPTAPPSGLLKSGTVELPEGSYALSLAVASGSMAGQPFNVSYQFQMSPVPLPPGLLLMVSGLVGLWAYARATGRTAC